MRINLAHNKHSCLLLVKGWTSHHLAAVWRVRGSASEGEHRFPRREPALSLWGCAFDPVQCILSLQPFIEVSP